MKKLLIYLLAAMLVIPAVGSEPNREVNIKEPAEVSVAKSSVTGKKKPKRKKLKRKYMFRPGARQN